MLELPDETRRRIFKELQAHFLDELGLEIGELQCQRLYEKMLSEIGSAVYNQAVQDCVGYLQLRLADMEIELHED